MIVKYLGASDAQVNWGSNDDPRGLLVEGSLYVVKNKIVKSFHTKLILEEYPGFKFNSACFEIVTKQ